MAEQMVELAGAMAKVGVGLLALPLSELPTIASVQVREGSSANVRLQLSAVEDRNPAGALMAWAQALPERVAYGREREDYIRLAVIGVIDGVAVEVWTHVTGEHLVDTGCFLSLPPGGETHALPIGVLQALAEHRAAVSTHA